MRGLPLKYRVLYFVFQRIGPLLVGAIARSMRINLVGSEHFESVREDGPYIIATLHGRMFIPVWRMRKEGVTALVSQSRDGEMVTRLVMGLGYRTVRGSSHRGALSAIRGLLTALKRGPVAILVDGPRGPREEPKLGALAVAKASGLPILPMAAAASPHVEFRSWDRFQLPRPFSRGVLVFGEPIRVPRTADGDALEEWRLLLKQRLLALRDEADGRVGKEADR